MSAKIINMEGQDVSPAPLSFGQQFIEEVIGLLQTMPLELVEEMLFTKYTITKK